MDRSLMIIVLTYLFTLVDSSTLANDTSNLSNSTELKNSSVDVADAINNFGYKLLLTIMQQNKDENVVISPTSVAALLAMTLRGTVGKTHQELARALGFSEDIIKSRINHEKFGDLLRSLNSNVSSKTVYSDAVFVDTMARLRKEYQDYLDSVYMGDALSVDFKRAVEVKDIINQWVAVHTEGKIDKFLQKPLPVETRAVLLSALYFRGQWEHPFLEDFTQKMPFRKPGNEVMVDLMLTTGTFNYTQVPEYDMQMIALNYNDSMTTLYALKPYSPSRLSLQDLMNRLDATKIDQLIAKMDKEKCVIRFPKMELQNNVELEDSLKSLGIQTLFTPGQANFALMVANDAVSNETELEINTRINGESDARGLDDILNRLPNPGLHIDTVIHDVKLTINEYGTEAVAATSGVLARSARLFYADSPFYMFIRNHQTKLNTFSAVIFDPIA